jgi:hypothetical protein
LNRSACAGKRKRAKKKTEKSGLGNHLVQKVGKMMPILENLLQRFRIMEQYLWEQEHSLEILNFSNIRLRSREYGLDLGSI